MARSAERSSSTATSCCDCSTGCGWFTTRTWKTKPTLAPEPAGSCASLHKNHRTHDVEDAFVRSGETARRCRHERDSQGKAPAAEGVERSGSQLAPSCVQRRLQEAQEARRCSGEDGWLPARRRL